MPDQILPNPDPNSRVTDGAAAQAGLDRSPISFQEDAEGFAYGPPAKYEGRLRDELHEVILLMGNVHHYEDAVLPVDTFLSEEERKRFNIPDGVDKMKVTKYERTDEAILNIDTGYDPGTYAIAGTQKESYTYEERIEPIRASILLRSTQGDLLIGLVVPSRAFSRDGVSHRFLKTEEEKESPKIKVSIWPDEDSYVDLETVFDDFLNHFNKSTVTGKQIDPAVEYARPAFEELRSVISSAEGSKNWQAADEHQLRALAHFYEIFFRGEVQQG